MKWLAPVSLIVFSVVAPASVEALRASNRQEVVALSDGVFEVIGRNGNGAVDYWCGAGYYARHQLATGATQRIYIWKGIGPSQTRPGKKAVQFSLTPPPNANTSPGYSLSVKAVGDNITSASALNYCYDRIDYSPSGSGPRIPLQDAMNVPVQTAPRAEGDNTEAVRMADIIRARQYA